MSQSHPSPYPAPKSSAAALTSTASGTIPAFTIPATGATRRRSRAMKAPPTGRALDKLLAGNRWLVISPDSSGGDLVRLISRAMAGIGAAGGIEVLQVATIDAASKPAKENEPAIDLVILDAATGEIASTLPAVTRRYPEARVVVTGRTPTLDEALEAFRHGALDYLPQPTDVATVRRRLRLAAGRRWLAVQTDRRLDRLKEAVHRLNAARRVVSQKVDLLCSDFVSAYGDVANQVEAIRLERALRDLLSGATDLEQLLCHAMDWLLRHMGLCNIAVFLTDDAGEAELGAYMKHTLPGDTGLVQWLQKHVVPQVAEAEGVLRLTSGSYAKTLDPGDSQQMEMLRQHVLGVTCEYLAEPLGTLVVFRPEDKPFTAAHEAMLKLAGGVFAETLTSLVRQSDDTAAEDDDADDGDEEDWWKRGDEAPY